LVSENLIVSLRSRASGLRRDHNNRDGKLKDLPIGFGELLEFINATSL
jgi:hypothetical protein